LLAAAMRYRVGGPLIDGLMAELGMTGASLNGMLAGTGAAGAMLPETAEDDDDIAPSTPSKATNGGGDRISGPSA
jgi:flotillin